MTQTEPPPIPFPTRRTTTTENKLFINGQERSWLTQVPETVDPSVPVPLVVDVHGLTGTKELIKSYSRFAEMSITEKFIVVWPDGISKRWDFTCDTTFLRTVISCTASNYNIDPHRVYFTGNFSFGIPQAVYAHTRASSL